MLRSNQGVYTSWLASCTVSWLKTSLECDGWIGWVAEVLEAGEVVGSRWLKNISRGLSNFAVTTGTSPRLCDSQLNASYNILNLSLSLLWLCCLA